MTSLLNNNEFQSPEATDVDSGEEYLTIGQMASEFQVSLRTLRFYEDRQLLSPLRQGTTRLYDRRQRSRLKVILKGKRLGFTLTEISAMLGTAAQEEPTQIEAVLAPDKILSQINELERQRERLDAAISELRATQERIAGQPELASSRDIPSSGDMAAA